MDVNVAKAWEEQHSEKPQIKLLSILASFSACEKHTRLEPTPGALLSEVLRGQPIKLNKNNY